MDADRNIPPDEPLLDCKEAAKMLNFSPLTVRRLAHDGLLPAIAFSLGKKGKYKKFKFRASEIRAHLDSLSQKARMARYTAEDGDRGGNENAE
jgi:excisionase family DNA binding protein